MISRSPRIQKIWNSVLLKTLALNKGIVAKGKKNAIAMITANLQVQIVVKLQKN